MENLLEEWFEEKKRLKESTGDIPLISEGDIWWISFGENIGFEINGKSHYFSRPAVIHKKFTPYFFLVIPTTTKPKNGTWYVQINHGGTDMFVCLHQARAVDYRRFNSRMGTINPIDKDRVRLGLLKLIG